MDKKSLVETIHSLAASDPANRQEDGEPYFDAPLVGFADALDTFFDSLKSVIGPHHMTPAQAFEAAFGGDRLTAGSVVSWSLPIAKVTRKSQREETRFPSRRWARTRQLGQEFNDKFARDVAAHLNAAGIRAAVPNQLPSFRNWADERLGWTSNWSERHIAFACGLGTFSLNDGLITPHGIAHRLGSVVVEAAFPPDARASDLRGNCLFAVKGKCGKCIKRCPAGAISKKGHDKARCWEYVYKTAPAEVGEACGVRVTGCGLCQADVPCEKHIPKGLRP